MPLKPAITLRQAGATDWPAVESLLRASGLPTAGARAHLDHFVLAVQGREIVGCAGAEIHGDVALLRSVAVAPGHHGHGIGRRLVQRLLDEVARRPITRVFLLTTTAAGWFARLGFEAVAASQAPGALKASAEFQGACPASATLMMSTLAAPPPREARPAAVIGTVRSG